MAKVKSVQALTCNVKRREVLVDRRWNQAKNWLAVIGGVCLLAGILLLGTQIGACRASSTPPPAAPPAVPQQGGYAQPPVASAPPAPSPQATAQGNDLNVFHYGEVDLRVSGGVRVTQPPASTRDTAEERRRLYLERRLRERDGR